MKGWLIYSGLSRELSTSWILSITSVDLSFFSFSCLPPHCVLPSRIRLPAQVISSAGLRPLSEQPSQVLALP